MNPEAIAAETGRQYHRRVTSHRKFNRASGAIVCGLLTLALHADLVFALEPDQIVLIVNKNEPIGVRLAAQYAAARQIPDGHTITLDLPATDEIDFLRYEEFVVPPIRQFLIDHGLRNQVTCLVTFYGVPFRIASRVDTPRNAAEVNGLKEELIRVRQQLMPIVSDLESAANADDPLFSAGTGSSLQELGKRGFVAFQDCARHISTIDDPQQRTATLGRLLKDLQAFGGPAALYARLGARELQSQNLPDAQRAQWTKLRDQIAAANEQLDSLTAQRYSPEIRAQILTLTQQNFGLFAYGQMLSGEIDYLDTEPLDPNVPNSQVTGSALDSELALLWWGFYPRREWQPNPLFYQFRNVHSAPVMMVMRLDGPDEQTVSNLIQASVAVEKTGLQGTVVIDGGAFAGQNKSPEFAEYEQSLRNVYELTKSKSNLPAYLDDKPSVILPHTVRNVALYCGWYSLRHYVPGCDFVPGAIGYHIASFEMIALHGDSEAGWVHGLLKDGCVCSIGAVQEPFLMSFPKPDAFFPVLMTGRLSLAEVYWRTTPMTSWMLSCIGDPLYRPFAAHPALSVDDLPADLKPALEPIEFSTTQPTAEAATGATAQPATQPTDNSQGHVVFPDNPANRP